jgi:hypothetical protein
LFLLSVTSRKEALVRELSLSPVVRIWHRAGKFASPEMFSCASAMTIFFEGAFYIAGS